MRTPCVLVFSLLLTVTLILPAATALAEAEAAPAAEVEKAGEKAKAGQKAKPWAPDRAYEGSVSAVDAKGLSVVLHSGKEKRFLRNESTAVRGQGRSWDGLSVGDNVKVRMRGKEMRVVLVQPSAAEMAAIEEERKARREQWEKSQKARKAVPKKKPEGRGPIARAGGSPRVGLGCTRPLLAKSAALHPPASSPTSTPSPAARRTTGPQVQ